MDRRDFLRVAGISAVGTTVIAEDVIVSTAAAESASTKDAPGPDRNSDTSGPTVKSPQQHSVTKAATTQQQVTLSGQLSGNYSSDVGQIRVGPPGENKSTEILSDGSFAVDVPRDTFIDLAYIEFEDGSVVFNGNPDTYYIDALEQLPEDRSLGTIEIPEANRLDLRFEDESEDSVSGIPVAVRSLDTETDRWWQISASTNFDGFYQFDNSPTGIEVAGDVQVALLADTDDSDAPDVDTIIDERLSVTETQSKTYTVDLISVNGDLARPSGAPVTEDNVDVFVDSDNFAEVVTNQDGGFETQLPQSADFIEGAYQIQYYRAGLLDRNEAVSGGSWVEMYAGPQLEGTVDENVGTIQLPEGNLVTARAVDETGDPVQGANITYRHQNQTQDTTASLSYPSDETGEIDLEFRSGIRLSGSVNLSASPPEGDRFVDTIVQQTITADEPTTVELELPTNDGGSRDDPPEDPVERALQIAGKNDPAELTQGDVSNTITLFNRGELSNGIDVGQRDVSNVITLFERN